MKDIHNKNTYVFITILIFAFSTFTISCKKENQFEVLELITSPAHSISQTRATVECVVINGKGEEQIDYGICWSTSPEPTIDSSKSYASRSRNIQGFASELSRLIPDTTYYARAYATYNGQSVYGNEITFQTLVGSIGTITDIDGNIYNTVIIGDQVWLVENLKTTRYRNGDPIPNVSSISQWDTLTTGAYSYYDNDINNVQTYGNLYNWYAVDDSRNIAPDGWHVATDLEWNTLVVNVGEQMIGIQFSAISLREEGNTHWEAEQYYSTNESGFTALPGGVLGQDGFKNLRRIGYWWTSTSYYPYYPYYWSMTGWIPYVERDNHKSTTGFSVRCVKD